jgi:HK97 family phage prohead protease
MSADNKRETRTLPLTELRTADENDKPVIEGHAAVFNSWSETLGGWFPFKEKVRAGAFAKTIKESDIRSLWNHDPNYVLGRNKAGTLELTEDEKGLFVRIYPPDTQWARDLNVSIARGDISQMSFGFTVEKDEWSSDEGVDTRELTEVKLYDVSPVTFPAYTATDVGVRALESHEAYKAEIRAKTAEAENAAKQKALERRKLQNLKIKLEIM